MVRLQLALDDVVDGGELTEAVEIDGVLHQAGEWMVTDYHGCEYFLSREDFAATEYGRAVCALFDGCWGMRVPDECDIAIYGQRGQSGDWLIYDGRLRKVQKRIVAADYFPLHYQIDEVQPTMRYQFTDMEGRHLGLGLRLQPV